MKFRYHVLLMAAEIPVAIAVAIAAPQFTSAEPTPQATSKPVVISIGEPVAKPVAKPVSKPVAKPVVKVPEATAGGTEPFWAVTVEPTGIVYSTPDSPKVRFAYVKPLQAQGRPDGLTVVYPLRKGAQQGTLVLQKMRSADCTDGMSDTLYPYSATLILNDRVMVGCARLKQP